MKVNVFLPCRKGSERVKNKNIRSISKYKYGLIEIKLNQLLKSKYINNIYLSTNDDEIIKYASALNSERIIIHKRKEDLSSSNTSTDQIVPHVLELIGEGEIMWTHVTSPFISAELYNKIILSYFNNKKKGYDSLMTTNLIYGYLWDKKGAINYNCNIEKWPRTQTLSPIHEINSAVFLSNSSNYQKFDDRIGAKPFLYPVDKIEGFDIDWEDDFKIAECLIETNVANL